MREEFERRAVQVLMGVPPHVWDRERVPIPVELIASEHFGLRVCFKSAEQMRAAPGAPPLGPEEHLSGLLLTDRGEIWVNAEEAETSRGRARFTISHEIGHFVMHRHAHPQALYCRARSMTHGEEESPAGPVPDEIDIEEEAHLFAAALLMPMPFVQREYARLRDGEVDFFGFCDRFGASGKAMSRRLRQVIPAGSAPPTG